MKCAKRESPKLPGEWKCWGGDWRTSTWRMSDRANEYSQTIHAKFAQSTFGQLSGKLFCHDSCPTGQATINKLSRPGTSEPQICFKITECPVLIIENQWKKLAYQILLFTVKASSRYMLIFYFGDFNFPLILYRDSWIWQVHKIGQNFEKLKNSFYRAVNCL